MHSCKGLEFARLVVVGVNSDSVPLPFAVAPEAVDAQQHELDLQRERCLLYVACTRARDELVVETYERLGDILRVQFFDQIAEGSRICIILGDNLIEGTIAAAVDRFRHQPRGARILLKRGAGK